MSTLPQYLAENNLTQAAFADRLNVHQGTISKLCSGKVPSLKLALKIERATKGKVRPKDLSAPAHAEATP